MNTAQRWWLTRTVEGRELLDGIKPCRRIRLMAACCEYTGLQPGGLLEHVRLIEETLEEKTAAGTRRGQ